MLERYAAFSVEISLFLFLRYANIMIIMRAVAMRTSPAITTLKPVMSAFLYCSLLVTSVAVDRVWCNQRLDRI